MKFALHTSTAISSVLKEPEHFYVDIYYLIILIIVAFTLLLLSFLRYHLYKTKKEKELREIASLVDKNEILIQRYSREMSHIKGAIGSEGEMFEGIPACGSVESAS